MTFKRNWASVGETFLAGPAAGSLRVTACTQDAPYLALHSRATKGARPALMTDKARPTRSWLVMAIRRAARPGRRACYLDPAMARRSPGGRFRARRPQGRCRP